MKKERKYLPTLAELIDRQSICLLKSIFIPDNKEAYDKEVADISHDIDAIIEEHGIEINSKTIKAAMIMMLSNRYIWENETLCRKGDGQDPKLLVKTHSINGVRNSAKNIVSEAIGERLDLKIDCLAADLTGAGVKEDWDVFKNERESNER